LKDDELRLVGAAREGVGGPLEPLGILGQDVEQDVAVDENARHRAIRA
jgi:hypothetical protein